MTRTLPPGMLDACVAMASYLRNVLAVVDGRPIFRLPPKEVFFIGPIDQIPQLAGNELAASVIRAFSAIGQGFGGVPTVRMLDVAVGQVDESLIERVPLSTFGRVMGQGRGAPS